MKKRFLYCFLALVIGYLIPPDFLTGIDQSFAGTVTIKFATLAPQGSTWAKVLDDVEKELAEKSGGNLKLRIYAGGVAGDDKDVIRKMRIGQIHSSSFTTTGLGEILPEVRVLDLPFLFNNDEELDFIRDKFNDTFAKKFEEKGYVLLGLTEVGNIYFLTNSPITSISDLPSTKMWMWEGDRLAHALFKTIKLSPISISIVNVMSSLQSGLIDGVYASPLAAVAFQWFGKTKYMLELPIANATVAILIKKKQFDKIPPDLQKLLKDTFKNHTNRLTQLIRKDNKESMKIIKESGIEITTLNQADIDKFKESGVKTRESLVNVLYSKEFLDSILTELDAFRKGK
ncbi:MAG: TRAP transporter substrate-binding protein [Candidatus Anammoxibacter sp.]